MKTIVILGNSIAAIKTVEILRREDSESRIIVVDPEGGQRPYWRDRLIPWVAKEISQDGVFYQSQKFYNSLKIEFVTGKIHRVSLRRKKITLEENKEVIEFDILIMADLGVDSLP
ncbi:MAG: NAD(P)/FAD-dependent oxidoreductase, partial [Candidatus Omnitrophica bacterium]|nr:NAD(P)/FAD-dependent oxidoreductase [Candidatus Omnitrophota bacterium]